LVRLTFGCHADHDHDNEKELHMHLLLTLVLLSARWGFDDGKAGSPPAGFVFGAAEKGASGKWVLRPAAKGTEKGMVLVQEDKTDDRYAVAIAGTDAFQDVKVSARIKTEAGGYQAAGIAWRVQDPDNYYVARINPDEENVNLFVFVGGKRRKLAGIPTKALKAGSWHTLAVEHVGSAITVSVDGKKLIEAKDATYAQPGKVGLWVKDDTVAQFDDLEAAPAKK
jgi:hypothetical protein